MYYKQIKSSKDGLATDWIANTDYKMEALSWISQSEAQKENKEYKCG